GPGSQSARYGTAERQRQRQLSPGVVEAVALPVEAGEAVRAEEITLALGEIGRAAALAVAVEIGQRRRKARDRQPGLGAGRDGLAQGGMAFAHERDEGRLGEQVSALPRSESLGDLVEEARTD